MRFVQLSNLSESDSGWKIRRRELLPVPPERAWQALTRPEELMRWWCDQADVELREGGHFRFAGPHAYPGTTDDAGRASNDCEFLSVEEPTKLSFRWPFGADETLVTYELFGTLESTELVVTQTAAGPPGGWWPQNDTERDALPNWWWCLLPALRTYLEKGRPDVRLDFAALRTGEPISVCADFTTFPWLVWHKLTTNEELARWWETDAHLEARADGTFELGFKDMGPRRVVTCDDGARLGHDWHWPGGETTQIEWTITETEDDTRVCVRDATPLVVDGTTQLDAIFWCSLLLNLKQLSERGIRPRDHQVF